MTSRIQMLTNYHISVEDIHACLNRNHQEEIESGEWHYRQKMGLLQSGSVKTDGTVSLTQGSTLVQGSGTSFGTSDTGKFLRTGGGHTSVPIRVADVVIFPDALTAETLTVTSAAAVAITTAYGGALGTRAEFTTLGGDIRYLYDGTTPTTTEGHPVLDGSTFTLTGHSNLVNFRMIAQSADVTVTVTLFRDTEEVRLAVPWPDISLTDVSYELFPRYYTVIADYKVEVVQRVSYTDVDLDKWSRYQHDVYDPGRSRRGDTARAWSHAGEDGDGEKLIELWPVTTVPRLYEVAYLAGHTPMVASSDRPLVPPTLLENRALYDCAMSLFAKTGDKRWTEYGDRFEKQYLASREKLVPADMEKYGYVEHLFDLSGVGQPRHFDYVYRINHDV
jgi:hypothetical protein